MNYATRVRWLQLLVGAALLGFLAILTSLLLERDTRIESPSLPAQESLEAEVVETQAEQVSTKFEVTRTREGTAELTVRAEKLLGLEGDVYLLEEPTLVIHHPGGETSEVVGASGTFNMDTGEGRVEGEAHARLRGTMEVEAPVLFYRHGGRVDAEGGTRFERPGMRGRSRRLSYLPGGEAVFLTGDVRVEGWRPGAEQEVAPWTLETQRLRYRSSAGEARTDAFRLVSSDGTLTGERLDLWLSPEDGRLQRLVSTTGAALRVALGSSEDAGFPVEESQVLAGDRIELEPAEDGSEEARRVLATGNARLFREGTAKGADRALRAESIEWFRESGPGGQRSRLEAIGGVVLQLDTDQGAAGLTASRLDANLDEFGDVDTGTAFAPVRYEGPEGNALCEEADFLSGGEHVVLRSPTGGQAVIDVAEGRIGARRIDLWRGRGELSAVDQVRTLHQRSAGGGGLFASDKPVHGTADRVVALRGEGRIRYLGAARLWQDENLIQADELEVVRDAGILEAKGRVSTRSVSQDEASGRPRVIRGAAQYFLYRDTERQATYSEAAQLQWGSDRVDADRIELSLGEGRTLHSLVGIGDVTLVTPARRGTGHRLDYDVATEAAILFGGDRLAMAQDLENQQVVYGQTLTIDLSDGTMELDSGRGGRTWITLSPALSPPDSSREILPGETRGEEHLGTPPGR